MEEYHLLKLHLFFFRPKRVILLRCMFCLGFHVYNFQILNVKISLKSYWCGVVTSGVGAEFVSHWVLNGGCSSYSLPQIWNVRMNKWLFCMHVCCNVYNFFSSVFYVCHYWHGMYRKFMNCIFFTTSYIISGRGRFLVFRFAFLSKEKK